MESLGVALQGLQGVGLQPETLADWHCKQCKELGKHMCACLRALLSTQHSTSTSTRNSFPGPPHPLALAAAAWLYVDKSVNPVHNRPKGLAPRGKRPSGMASLWAPDLKAQIVITPYFICPPCPKCCTAWITMHCLMLNCCITHITMTPQTAPLLLFHCSVSAPLPLFLCSIASELPESWVEPRPSPSLIAWLAGLLPESACTVPSSSSVPEGGKARHMQLVADFLQVRRSCACVRVCDLAKQCAQGQK
eukprot:1158514-Pelagomonas_calceolata.AAC.13